MQTAYNFTGKPLAPNTSAILALPLFRPSGRPQIIRLAQVLQVVNLPDGAQCLITARSQYKILPNPPWLVPALRAGLPILTRIVKNPPIHRKPPSSENTHAF